MANFIVTSPELPSVKRNTSLPPSLNTNIPVCESRFNSAPESNVIGLAPIVTPVVPSCVSVTSPSAPMLITELSELRVTLSPTIKSSSTVISGADKCAKASTTFAEEPLPSR